MSVTPTASGKLGLSLWNGEIDISTMSLKVLLTNGYTFDPDTHQYRSSVTGEVTGTGYTAGGKAVGNAAVTYDAATNTIKLDGDDVEWDTSTITADGAVFYIDTGSAATDPIVTFWDLGGDQVSTAGTFLLTMNAAGVYTSAPAA